MIDWKEKYGELAKVFYQQQLYLYGEQAQNMKNNNSFVTLNQTILSYSDWDQVNESLVLDNCKFGNVTEVEKKYETRIQELEKDIQILIDGYKQQNKTKEECQEWKTKYEESLKKQKEMEEQIEKLQKENEKMKIVLKRIK